MLSGLPLKVQKAVLGRLILNEVLESYRAELREAGYDAVWKGLAGRILEYTRLAFERPRDDYSVAEYLAGLIGSLESFDPLDATAGVVCGRVLDDAYAAVDRYCTSPQDPLLPEFQTALDVAERFYSSSGIEIPADMRQNVKFVAGWSLSTPHPFPACQQLGGLTTLSPRRLAAKLKLTVVPLGLDWRTYLAIPYILLHELVSHTFVGPWVPPQRAEHKADPRFAEGWMDTVAFQVHEEIMRGRGTLGAFGSRFGFESERLESARRLHDARYVPGGDGQAYGARDLGRQAANRVLGTFKRLPETQSDPLGGFWRLSTALNSSPLEQFDRRKVVFELHRHLKPTQLSKAPPVIDVLRRWIAASSQASGNEDHWDAASEFGQAILHL